MFRFERKIKFHTCNLGFFLYFFVSTKSRHHENSKIWIFFTNLFLTINVLIVTSSLISFYKFLNKKIMFSWNLMKLYTKLYIFFCIFLYFLCISYRKAVVHSCLPVKAMIEKYVVIPAETNKICHHFSFWIEIFSKITFISFQSRFSIQGVVKMAAILDFAIFLKKPSMKDFHFCWKMICEIPSTSWWQNLRWPFFFI